MTKVYPDITKDFSQSLKVLRQEIPETMQAFSALAQTATKDGALDKKTKELIALALGVAPWCDGCIGFHNETLVRFGASRQEVLEVLSMAVYMGGGPSPMYAADAIKGFTQYQEKTQSVL
jgi:AhpD family alkylhydroperoxidase